MAQPAPPLRAAGRALFPGTPVRTTCPYCGVGCGIAATARADGAVEIAGDAAHPANLGSLCAKGAALGETLGIEGRLLYPLVREAGGALRRASWDEALERVARGLHDTIERHGPEAVAFYVSGQLLTEDYYVANKLVKGFLGTANIDTNSRLCMASAVAAHRRAFGADSVPACYEDLEQADLVVLAGSNAAWCHPVLYQRLVGARARRPRMRIVAIDPRLTATCEDADLHLPIRPGTDVALFNGLLAFLDSAGCRDARFVAAHTAGAEQALAAARATSGSPAHVARACGLAIEPLLEFYRMFARTERVVTLFSQGVNQSSAGVDKANAIINCHLLTGRIGCPGMGPFSVTGQPNAMGGREVGALATALAAHLELGEPEHQELVREFWASPRIAERPGLKALELFEAVEQGRVRALWIMATNPAVSLPDAARARAALSRCELVVVSDVVARTDTAGFAHVLLAAAAWGEKDGTVTNSERRISRQRAFLRAPGEVKPDWWIITQVARRMGYGAGFPYESAHEIFLEHARLSAYRNGAPGRQGAVFRDFNLAGLAALEALSYDSLEPVQWPLAAGAPPAARRFGDGRFCHPDGRARLVPLVPRAPCNAPDDEYPFVFNTGRTRDQWHSMTRTGRSPRLAAHAPEPYLEIHPHDALGCGVQEGRLARVVTRWGSCVVRVRASATVPRRHIFVPIHWSDQNASDARVGALVNPVADPISGEPEFKHTPARVEPFAVDWYGFVLAREELRPAALGRFAWWARAAGEAHVRYEIAGRGAPPDWALWARALLGAAAREEAGWLEASDPAAGMFRAACLRGERLVGCVFVSPRPENLPPRAWLGSLFAAGGIAPAQRIALLAGAPPGGADPGPIVCSCCGVGREEILRSVRERALGTLEALGRALGCGSRCGSCVPELRALLAGAREPVR